MGGARAVTLRLMGKDVLLKITDGNANPFTAAAARAAAPIRPLSAVRLPR